MIKTVFDACVLYSASLRGFFLSLATGGLLDPFWSAEIQNEWTDNLLENRPDLKRETLVQVHRNMEHHFPNGLIRGYESIIPTLLLPDMNDRHVFAVAIHVQAECIVTFNLEDFPNAIMQSYGIEAISPDEFALRLIKKEFNRAFRAIKKHRLSLTRPPKTVDEYLATLERQGLIKTAAFLREQESDI